MNRPKRDMTADDDRRFDLLVDGELSPAERRELLRNLDDEPGAWRRCALAFLEAQAWREDFGTVLDRRGATASATAIPKPTAPKLTGRKPSAAKPWQHERILRTGGTLLAMAASFLVALMLGWWVYRADGPPAAPPDGRIELAEEAPRPGGPSVGPLPQLASRESGIPPESAAMPEPAAGGWRWVTLAPEQGLPDGIQPVRLPVVETDVGDDAWLQSLPAGVPAEVFKALRQAGHQVSHQRQVVPLPLEDGRSLLVPVDEVDVHYVGNELYR